MKKVILITPSYDFAGNARVAKFTSLLSPPLGILALGSYLATHDVPVELIDVQMDFGFGLTNSADHLVSQRVARYLRDQVNSTAWIGISQPSSSDRGIALAQEIHTVLPDMPIIFGGYFPSTTYQILLEKYPFITAIVRGDGEAAALHISRSLAQGRSFLSCQTPNLAWWDEKVHTTPIQPMTLDELPILDFRLLCNSSHYQLITLITSRGCPFQCNYCLENTMRPYSEYRPTWLARQLTHLETELPNERIVFFEPIFGLGRERTLEMCQIMRGRRFAYGLESRADVLTPDLVPALREAGVEMIYLGIESASAATLLRMNKVRSATQAKRYLSDGLEILKACFENGITPFVGFMVGYPGSTEADLQATLDFARKISQLYHQIVARTGAKSGFVPLAFDVKVYDGSPLANRLAEDFPQVVVRSDSSIGRRTVLSPSPGLYLDVIQRYQVEIARQGEYTPLALERWQHYYLFSIESFLAAHPEVTNNQGVTILGDSLRRFPQKVTPAPILTTNQINAIKK